MTSRYQIRVINTSGTTVAVLDDEGGFESITISKHLIEAGYYTLMMRANDSRVNLFGLDSRVEVWRSNADWGLDWYREFSGFHRRVTWTYDDNGVGRFESHGPGLLSLLARRYIAYKAGTSKTEKSGAAESVLKEYVKQNAGSDATTGNGRELNGTTTGLTIQTDAAAGPTWSGAKAWRNLLTACQEIALKTGVEFDIVLTGGATFEFRTYSAGIGSDRSAVGVNTYTGLNGAGNVPIVFSVEMETMAVPEYAVDRLSEENAIIGLGRGENENRTVVVQKTDTLIDDSPWNQMEGTAEATDAMTTEAVTGKAAQVLKEMTAFENFRFTVVQQPKVAYGLHYVLGDKITAKMAGATKHLRIIGLGLKFEDGQETLNAEFAELP